MLDGLTRQSSQTSPRSMLAPSVSPDIAPTRRRYSQNGAHLACFTCSSERASRYAKDGLKGALSVSMLAIICCRHVSTFWRGGANALATVRHASHPALFLTHWKKRGSSEELPRVQGEERNEVPSSHPVIDIYGIL